MSTNLYLRLSAMMFLEFAVWGAWAPVLAARLLGPLKMNGKQTGWIYATLPLACIISPLIAGQLADQYVNSEWILGISHLIGGILLLVAARLQNFKSLFSVMLLYSLCYGATLPLVNSLMFAQMKDRAAESPAIFIWAPIAWALVGYSLTAWRMTRKKSGDGSDCLVFGGLLSFVMVAVCYFLPATPPPATGKIPLLVAIEMLKDPSFLAFLIISSIVAGMMQFYFLGTAQFMQDNGISGKSVPACMAIAQASQALATYFILGWFLGIGFKATLLIGAASWLLMYIIYVAIPKRSLIAASQSLHGIAYVLFIIAGQIYGETVAPKSISSSMQALVMVATTGIGLFLGTQFAGIIMDKFSVDGKFVWRKIWTVPGVVVLVGIIALAILFNNPQKSENPVEKPAAVETPESASAATLEYIARVE